MLETLFEATYVSVLENVFCKRKMVSLGSCTPTFVGSEKTIQPLCHVAVLAQVLPSVETQTVTVRPSLIASARANCRSPTSPFDSPAMRLALVTYRNDGTAIERRIAATAMVITTSTSVKPWARMRLNLPHRVTEATKIVVVMSGRYWPNLARN